MAETRTTIALNRAAQQERQQLEAYRQRLVERVNAVEAEAETLRSEVRRVDDRIRRIEAVLADVPDGSADGTAAPLPSRVLRGAELREQATRVLAARAGVGTPVHYRQWLQWVEEAGFVILGKRPHATFLTAVGRSPITRRGEEPGTYVLDPSGSHELACELSELRGELADLDHVLHREPGPRPDLTKHRATLLLRVRRVTRQLDEAQAVLATPRSITAARRSRGVA
jgi:uncharacterized protein YhaN